MAKNLKIFFAIRSLSHFHYYRSIIESLTRRGHRVELVFDERWSKDRPNSVVEDLASLQTLTWSIKSEADYFGRRLLFYSREILSYRRYLKVAGQSAYYEKRWLQYLPPAFKKIFKHRLAKALLKSFPAGAALKIFEYLIPPSRIIKEHLRQSAPDAVIAGPVNLRFSSLDLEYLKAANYLGIPTAIPVISWDNLTTKGLIHVRPNRLFVWNNSHKVEALEHHNIKEKSIRVAGAPVFDKWFAYNREPEAQSQFLKRHNLPLGVPMLLYLGSSANIAPNEVWLVRKLRALLSNADNPKVRKTHIIVRPHPANFKIYENLNESGITVLPKSGTLPDATSSMQLFHDTLSFSFAVLGINTSAMIEALIKDKPVIALITENYRATQKEAQHFKYLIDAQALLLLNQIDTLPQVLLKLLNGKDGYRGRRRAFVNAYIRPRGLEVPAGEIIRQEIEKLS